MICDFLDVITTGDNLAVGVLGYRVEICDVFGRWRRAVREEEGLESGVLGYTELRYQLELYHNGLDKRMGVDEQGD